MSPHINTSHSNHLRKASAMSQAIQIYQTTLSEKGYGTPMWTPEPSPFEALIGDVGFIDKGESWVRLLNILYPGSDEEINHLGVPADFEPLDLKQSKTQIKRLPRHLRTGVYETRSIRSISIGGGVST